MDFSWNGVSAQTYHGIVVKSLPPVRTPQKRDETIVVPGRAGALHRQDGSWEELLMTVDCYLPYEQGASVTALETIRAWLRGSGWATFSNRPGRKYRAHIISQIEYRPWVIGFADIEFQVIFEAEPFGYFTNLAQLTFGRSSATQPPASETIIEFAGTEAFTPIATPGDYPKPDADAEVWTFIGAGTAPAAPLIRVNGSGLINININGDNVELTQVNSFVMLDCYRQECYRNANPMNRRMSGNFPLLKGAGETNSVSISANATSLVIVPNWRDIG